MSKILFIGDPHLNYQTPSSRKDVYPQTILEKIKTVAKLAEEQNIDDVIFLGDMFHQRYQPYSYMMKCFLAFKEFKKPPYSIIGNHDIIFERADTFEESPLNFLMMTGVVKHLDELEYGDTLIKGFDYTTPITKNEVNDKYVICVAHQYYNTPLYKFYIKPEDALNLNYPAYVLGHDHSVYDDITNDKFKVIRPGSLSRGTAHSSNLMRDVYGVIFDTVTKTFTRITIPTQKATDVFKEIKYIEKSLETSVDEIIDKMEFSADVSIYDMIDEAKDVPDNVKQLIIQYLEKNGIFRKGIVANQDSETSGESVENVLKAGDIN